VHESLAEVNAYIEKGLAFEVKFDGDKAIVAEPKGITKVTLSKEEMKKAKIGKKKAGRKVPKPQKVFLSGAADILLNAKIPFKVTYGPKECTLRFDLDHYIHVYPDRVSVLGFNKLEDHPIALIKGLLADLPNVKMLSPSS